MSNELLQHIARRADLAYAAREDIKNVSESVELLRNNSGNADQFETLWRLSRGLFFLGQEARAEGPNISGGAAPFRQSARSFHVEGVKSGRRARQLRPERVEGHF